LCSLILGSISSRRCAFSRPRVPSSSAPMSRLCTPRCPRREWQPVSVRRVAWPKRCSLNRTGRIGHRSSAHSTRMGQGFAFSFEWRRCVRILAAQIVATHEHSAQVVAAQDHSVDRAAIPVIIGLLTYERYTADRPSLEAGAGRVPPCNARFGQQRRFARKASVQSHDRTFVMLIRSPEGCHIGDPHCQRCEAKSAHSATHPASRAAPLLL
jgi:hypothetical protein